MSNPTPDLWVPDDPGEPPAWMDEVPPIGLDVPATPEIDRITVTSEKLAMWIGLQAAKLGVVPEAQRMIHPSAVKAFTTGSELPATAKLPHGLTEAERSQWIRELRKAGGRASPVAPPVLAVTIGKIVQRADVGMSTRYDVTLVCDGKEYLLRHLEAVDLLSYERIRPLALNVCLVLDPLPKGAGPLWMAEVRRAMSEVQIVQMTSEESEAMDIRHRLLIMATGAKKWSPCPEEPRPIGLVCIERTALIGWTREPMQQEIRNRLGKCGRDSMISALQSLGWVAREWKFGNHSVYVWARDAEGWRKLLESERR